MTNHFNSFQTYAIAYAAERGVTLEAVSNWVRNSDGEPIYTERGVRAYVASQQEQAA